MAIASFLARSIFGDSAAANDIMTAGTAALNVASALQLFAAGAMGPVGLASSMLTGLSMISSLFASDGPTADQLILQGLNQLNATNHGVLEGYGFAPGPD